MLKKFTLTCYFIILVLLVIGCKAKVEQNPEVTIAKKSTTEANKFNENYRPQWWENIEDSEYLHSYSFADGVVQETVKTQAINSAQAKFLHFQKRFVVNLTALILDESASKEKFKSNKINSKNSLIYSKDFSSFLKSKETEFIQFNDNKYRCFVAVGLPLDAIQKEYVFQMQKDKTIAKAFAKSPTYRMLLKNAGIKVPAEEKITKQKVVKKEVKQPTVSKVKYDKDIMPAWYKIAYNNKKVMVNQTATADSEDNSVKDARSLCYKHKNRTADNFVRAEMEKYRQASGYDEIKFNELKNKASSEVKNSDFPITKEFVKTIQIGKNSYKTYAQYSINKTSIQSSIIKVLRSDDVLFSRLRSSMLFDDLGNQ